MKNKYNYIVATLFTIKTIVEFFQSMDKSSWWNVINLISGIILVIGFIKNNKTIIIASLIPSITSKMIILGLVVMTEVQSLLLSIPWAVFPVLFIMNLSDFLYVILYLTAILAKKEFLLYISSFLLIISILIRFNGIGFANNIFALLFINVFAIILTKDTTIFENKNYS